MNTALCKLRLSPEAYLAGEDAAEFKSEYHDGEVFAMAGSTYAHAVISTNLTVALGNRLKGGSCRPLNNDLRVMVPDSSLYTYPDASVVCGAPQFAANSPTTITNPTVIVEVLSPSTERYDRTAKFWHYQNLAALQDYVLVTQDAAQVERFSRQGEQWLYAACKGLESVLHLPSLNIDLPLRDLYEGVEFPAVPLLLEFDPLHPRSP